jgi:drug/metabolite transporter (DMT)-like permease
MIMNTSFQTRRDKAGMLLSWPLLAFATIVVLLGVNFVAVRFSNAELPPFWGAALRFIIASAILFTIVRLRRIPLPRGKALTGAVLYGVVLFGVMYALAYWSLLFVNSGIAAVTFATIPLLTMLMAVSLKLERLTWRSAAGVLLVILGIGVVFQEQLRADVPFLPLLFLLLGALSGALSGIIIKRFPRSHPISTNAVGMAVGSAILVVLSVAFGETWRLPALPATWAALGWLIMSASISFILMVWLLSKWTATAVSYSTVLQPLVTVAVASWLAGEQITLLFVIGGLLALAGVYVGVISGQREQALPRPAPVSEPAEAGAA